LGAVGAALATLIAEFVGLAVSAVWSGRLMHVPVPLRSFAKVSLATGAMMGVMAYLPSRPDTQGLALAVVAGLAVYTVVFMLVFAREVGTRIGPHHALARWLMRS
jgi:O-antigen/teichoic acid export membrane protein